VTVGVLVLVLASLWGIACHDGLLCCYGHGNDGEAAALERPGAGSCSSGGSQALDHLGAATEAALRRERDQSKECGIFARSLAFVEKELSVAVRVAIDCGPLLIARALTNFGLTLIIGPAPLPSIDLFAKTPLRYGFRVLWVDIVGVITSTIVLPLVLSPAFGCHAGHCINATYLAAAVACAVASAASIRSELNAFELAMVAALAMSACTALSNTILALRMVDRLAEPGSVGRQHSGVALGWGLLAGGVAQLLGARCGAPLFMHASLVGVTAPAGFACLAGWFAAAKSRSGQHPRGSGLGAVVGSGGGYTGGQTSAYSGTIRLGGQYLRRPSSSCGGQNRL